MKVLGIIPARYSSLRFPGKPLVDIAGKSMIQRVYEQAIKCKDLNKVLVATDDDKIFNHVKLFNGNVIITSSNHQSGTDRCAEAVEKIGEDYDIIINIQGDEPTINPFQISSLIKLLKNSKEGIGTLYKKIKSQKELDDLNTVKLIFNDDFEAINFFRENLFDKILCNKHIGMYGFRKETLMEITRLPLSINEKKHNLEQLRWLDNYYKIKVLETKIENISIDTIDDLKKLLNNTKF